MSITTGEFPVYANEQHVGWVTIAPNGLMTAFDCRCTYKSREILRLAAVCGGRYVSLGVMMPEAETLRFKKSFTKNALSGIGYDNAAAFCLIRPDEVYQAPDTAPATDVLAATESTADEASLEDLLTTAVGITHNAEMPMAVSPISFSPEETDEPLIETEVPARNENSSADAVPNDVTSNAASNDASPYGVFTVLPDESPAAAVASGLAGSASEAESASEPAAVSDDLADQLMSALLQMTSKKDETNPDEVQSGNEMPPSEVPFAPYAPEDDIPVFDELELYEDDTQEYEDGWFLADDPAALFEDADIAKTCEDVTDALMMEREDGTLLAVPVSHDKPFPMMSVFCFGTSRLIGRREYIVFKIKNGYLTL
jgi:hypothetical protein